VRFTGANFCDNWLTEMGKRRSASAYWLCGLEKNFTFYFKLKKKNWCMSAIL